MNILLNDYALDKAAGQNWGLPPQQREDREASWGSFEMLLIKSKKSSNLMVVSIITCRFNCILQLKHWILRGFLNFPIGDALRAGKHDRGAVVHS